MNEDRHGVEKFPCQNSILLFFYELRDMQEIMEASLKPTIHLVFPWLEEVKNRLEAQVLGLLSSSSQVFQNYFSQEFAKCTLDEVNRIEVHDLWMGECLLHPGLRKFSFARLSKNGEDVKIRAERITRRMLTKEKMQIRRVQNRHQDWKIQRLF